MEFAEARILVFTKAPIPGQAKTRLIPTLGEKGAAELHSKLTRHSLNTATKSNLCPVELWYASHPDHAFFSECMNDYPVTLKQQHGEDIGQRMAHALNETLKTSAFAIIIGSDCPGLTKDDLRIALRALKDGNDCVLGPAEDGGYVLIGLSRFDERLFQNIQWGSNSVLKETQNILSTLGWQWQKLKAHHDIDRPEDLQHLNSLIF